MKARTPSSGGSVATRDELESDENCARRVEEAESVWLIERMASRDQFGPGSCGHDGICEVAQGRCFLLDRYTLLQPLDGEHHAPVCRSALLGTHPTFRRAFSFLN
jgi:hypothetical protein